MKVLFIDTTTSDLVVAIVEENSVINLSQPTVGVKHSEILCCKVDELLSKTGLTFDDIDAYACAIGPGSFTGIRIGISTVKGYNLAKRKPFMAVNCLEAISRSEKCGKRGSAIIDAGNGYYFANYADGILPCLVPYDSDLAIDASHASNALDYFDGVIDIIRSKFFNSDFNVSLEPLYIRKSQAEERR